MSAKLPELSPAQLNIMELIWDRGELTATEIRDHLASDRDVSRNTIRTTLERMESKGWIDHREDGRTFYYYAVHPREVTIGEKITQVVENVCGGSPELLVNALIDYRGLSQDELTRIQKLLSDAKREQSSQSKGKK